MALFRRSRPSEDHPPPDTGGGRQELHALLREVLGGTLPLEHGCRRAEDLGSAGAFSPSVLADASDAAFQRMSVNPVEAWQLGRIVQAAARAAWQSVSGAEDSSGVTNRPVAVALVVADTDLISEAHARLHKAGDIRLFAAAREAAGEALTLARTLGMTQTEGTILQRRGAMTLDCYTASSAGNFRLEWNQWVSRALQTGDPELMSAVSTPMEGSSDSTAPLRWPEPVTALCMAAEDLRAALPLVERSRRGAVLKALAQTLEWRALLGGPDAGPELVEIGEAALAELSPDDIEPRLFVTALLDRAKNRTGASSDEPANTAAAVAPDVAALVDQVENDWDRLAERPATAWAAAQQAAGALADYDPRRAMRLLARQRQLPDQWAMEARREAHYRTELLLVSKMSAPAAWRRAWQSITDFESVTQEVLASVDAYPPEAVAGGLTLLILASTKFDREGIGLQAHAILSDLCPAERSRHSGAYDMAAAGLAIGEGVNRERADDHTAAVHWFITAADGFLSTSASEGLTSALGYAADLVEGGRASELVEVSTWCVRRALAVEVLSPVSAGTALQRLIRVLIAHQVRHGTSIEEVQLLFQAAKGRRFAASLAEGITSWSAGSEIGELLHQESLLMAEMPDDGPLLTQPENETGLDEEDVLVAYSNEYETSPADDIAGRLVNLRRGIERRIAASLMPHAESPGEPVPMSRIREALDDRTALVSLYEGQWVTGEMATYSIVITRTTEHISVGAERFPFPAGPIGMGSGGRNERKIYVPPGGLSVAEMRRAVQEEPAPRTVTPEAAESLATLAHDELRVVIDNLDELHAQGIAHLLVLPHGAGHFAPLHLAGDAGHPLAEKMTVTYIANLAQLVSPPARPVQPRAGAAVFALSYRDQPRLPYLESSESEGRMIAGVLGVRPMLDGAATESRFLEALQSARWVHLRAHGRHDVDAPMFQTVFLSPGDRRDGRLRAYEVLPLDLRGLELVTLGACQTALGRMDASDNVRGLPAALLLAGASAVIGTLWDVMAETSTVFFTALYRCLAREHADVISAFGVAQAETRAQHPEYRDWGAFYLSGGCGVRARA